MSKKKIEKKNNVVNDITDILKKSLKEQGMVNKTLAFNITSLNTFEAKDEELMVVFQSGKKEITLRLIGDKIEFGLIDKNGKKNLLVPFSFFEQIFNQLDK